VKWYELISKYAPEFFTESKEEKKADEKEESTPAEEAEPAKEKTTKKKV
jgi:hypothetical protein